MERSRDSISAFNKLGLPLTIVGEGDDQKRLKKMANGNITFLGGIEDEKLVVEYAKAQAIIFTPELEYGLIPIEANACGTPVIAYGVGGVCETMIPWTGNDPIADTKATAIFFDAQTDDSLAQAVHTFTTVTFDQQTLLDNAERFSEERFIESVKHYIESAYLCTQPSKS